MDVVTKAVSQYVKDKGIQVSVISENTKIPYGILHPCIAGKRNLRAEEFLRVCDFLEVDPKRFWNSKSA